jgi:hypothetical protein
MQLKLNRDAVSGLLLILVGGGFAVNSLDYGIGSAVRMGSGYFPLLLGSAMVLVGAAVGIGGLRRGAEPIHVPWRELLLISFSVASFALMIGPFGLFPALGVSVVLACFADHEQTPRRMIGIVLFSLLLIWLVFVVSLNSPVALIKV